MVTAKKTSSSKEAATKEAITKDMTFADILHQYPEVEDVVLTSGLHCLGCSGAAFESVEVGCKMHGFSDTQVKKLVEEMNKKLKQTKK